MSKSLEIQSPVVGTVLELPTPVNTVVKAGDEIAVVESMKMEIPIVAPTSGRVGAIAVAVGQTVQAGDLLITLTIEG